MDEAGANDNPQLWVKGPDADGYVWLAGYRFGLLNLGKIESPDAKLALKHKDDPQALAAAFGVRAGVPRP